MLSRIKLSGNRNWKLSPWIPLSLSIFLTKSRFFSFSCLEDQLQMAWLLSNDFQLKWLSTCCTVFILQIYCNKWLDGLYGCWELLRWKISAKYRRFLSHAVVCFIHKFKNGPNIAICRLIKENHLSYFIYKLPLWIWKS